jgi:cation diffusion facilitator CzcD-associated flavoprotein CzcO
MDASPPKRVAIIGSGIAGLTTAFLLSRAGHHVEIFEREPEIGMVSLYNTNCRPAIESAGAYALSLSLSLFRGWVPSISIEKKVLSLCIFSHNHLLHEFNRLPFWCVRRTRTACMG